LVTIYAVVTVGLAVTEEPELELKVSSGYGFSGRIFLPKKLKHLWHILYTTGGRG
jgi:hypothetical protein